MSLKYLHRLPEELDLTDRQWRRLIAWAKIEERALDEASRR